MVLCSLTRCARRFTARLLGRSRRTLSGPWPLIGSFRQPLSGKNPRSRGVSASSTLRSTLTLLISFDGSLPRRSKGLFPPSGGRSPPNCGRAASCSASGPPRPPGRGSPLSAVGRSMRARASVSLRHSARTLSLPTFALRPSPSLVPFRFATLHSLLRGLPHPPAGCAASACRPCCSIVAGTFLATYTVCGVGPSA